MKKILLLLLIFTALSIHAQQKTTYDLNWKITDTLTYETVMREEIVEQDLGQTQNDSISDDFRSLFKSMQKEMAGLTYETKLYPDKSGNIDITMFVKQEKDTATSIFSEMAKINGNVVLRGKVSREGELLSFYYNQSQNNLIAILYQLPTKPVAIGDEWELDVNMISMNHNFTADSLYRKNKVRLKDVKNNVAIIEYDIEEYVAGDLGNGVTNLFTGGDNSNQKTFMRMTHQAIAKFDLEKGYWIKYEGYTSVETNFKFLSMTGNNRTQFLLIPKN